MKRGFFSWFWSLIVGPPVKPPEPIIVTQNEVIYDPNNETYIYDGDVLVDANEEALNQLEESMMSKKYALCMGINKYNGSPLQGCVNDANNWAEYLKGEREYDEVTVIYDKQVTRKRVRKEITELIKKSEHGDQLTVTYSGHGTSVVDKDGDDGDGRDEAICLYDGLMIDDEMRELVSELKDGVNLTVVLDSCHSGTCTRAFFDTLYSEEYVHARYMPPEDDIEQKTLEMVPAKKQFMYTEEDMGGTLLLSGTDSLTYSYDARINGKFQGAFSYTCLKILRENPDINYTELHKKIREKLPSKNWPQKPQLEGTSKRKSMKAF